MTVPCIFLGFSLSPFFNYTLLKHTIFVVVHKDYLTEVIFCPLKICYFDDSGLGRRLKMYDALNILQTSTET